LEISQDPWGPEKAIQTLAPVAVRKSAILGVLWHSEVFMEFKLIGRRQETSDSISFIFDPPSSLHWKAGQYLHYILEHPHPDDRGVERYFSIASAPHEKQVMLTTRFAAKGSSFKNALKNLRMGDVVKADGLDGDFVVDNSEQDRVFVAGGIGVTPYRAILLDLDHRHQPINGVLLYANRNDEFPYKNELEALQKKHPRFHIEYFVSPRRIDEAVIRRTMQSLKDPLVYVSGPEPMVESFDSMLKKMGVPESKIKNDFFPGYEWPG
jgi:ferredoxin-NADP reductase